MTGAGRQLSEQEFEVDVEYWIEEVRAEIRTVYDRLDALTQERQKYEGALRWLEGLLKED